MLQTGCAAALLSAQALGSAPLCCCPRCQRFGRPSLCYARCYLRNCPQILPVMPLPPPMRHQSPRQWICTPNSGPAAPHQLPHVPAHPAAFAEQQETRAGEQGPPPSSLG